MSETPDRNGPCPCGSGKKYKNCCINKKLATPQKSPRTLLYVVVVAAGVVIAGATISNRNASHVPAYATTPANPNPNPAPAAGGLQPPPPGPVPPGKVWSPEHGHWHDAVAPGNAAVPMEPMNFSPPVKPTYTPGPPPPGPTPEGKVWSFEHGHWHDIPGYVNTKTELKRTDEAQTPELNQGVE